MNYNADQQGMSMVLLLVGLLSTLPEPAFCQGKNVIWILAESCTRGADCLSMLLKEVASCPKQRLLCYKVLQELVCNNKKLKAHPSFYQPYINHNINHWIISRACQRHQWNLEYSRKHTSHCETCIGLEDLGLHIYTSFCWLWSMEGGGGGGRFCLIATVLLWFLCMDKVMFLLHIYKGEVSDNCFIELSWFAAMGIVFQSIYCCTKPKD